VERRRATNPALIRGSIWDYAFVGVGAVLVLIGIAVMRIARSAATLDRV
jgi:hypothetical protein